MEGRDQRVFRIGPRRAKVVQTARVLLSSTAWRNPSDGAFGHGPYGCSARGQQGAAKTAAALDGNLMVARRALRTAAQAA